MCWRSGSHLAAKPIVDIQIAIVPFEPAAPFPAPLERDVILFFADDALPAIDQQSWVTQIAPVALYYRNEWRPAPGGRCELCRLNGIVLTTTDKSSKEPIT